MKRANPAKGTEQQEESRANTTSQREKRKISGFPKDLDEYAAKLKTEEEFSEEEEKPEDNPTNSSK